MVPFMRACGSVIRDKAMVFRGIQSRVFTIRVNGWMTKNTVKVGYAY
jgi:hypothetical protein